MPSPYGGGGITQNVMESAERGERAKRSLELIGAVNSAPGLTSSDKQQRDLMADSSGDAEFDHSTTIRCSAVVSRPCS